MISLQLDIFIFVFLCIGLLSIIGLWVYYDWRERMLYGAGREVSAYHCVKCGHIYSATGGHSAADCPECGFRNPKLSF